MDQKVGDNDQKVTTSSGRITILPVPPTVEDVPATLGDAAEGTAIVISPRFTLSATSFNVRIDWGDGTIEDFAEENDIRIFLAARNLVVAIYMHKYDNSGLYNIEGSTTDNDDLTTTFQTFITVVNVHPSISDVILIDTIGSTCTVNAHDCIILPEIEINLFTDFFDSGNNVHQIIVV